MNRLKDSASLYLRQHAGNPVHWQPWDEEALDRARELDRPILLSIGYSACHWCHVMAHESFENEAVGQLMNELFLNIKVDREERPDLDKVYQLSHQLLTGRGGGWPLTVFLDPSDLTPFFAGTYFPLSPRHGLPAFPEVLTNLRAWFDSNREEVNTFTLNLRNAIASIQQPGEESGEADEAAFDRARDQLLGQYDPENGGFGGAPKFPQAPLLAMLQPLALRSGDDAIRRAMSDSLELMSRGGLRDHLDGGFFRYTVDGTWTIPHFEKMLYDNAQLLPMYAENARATASDWMAEVADGIAQWMLDDMRQTNGGFSSSMDADADGEEGGFHVWQTEELEEVLSASEFQLARRVFGLDGPPNFEGRAWHLTRRAPATDSTGLTGITGKLRAARAQRVAPATDTKQLTAWNALCVEGFARAGIAMQRDDWLDVAEGTLRFLADTCRVDGQLYAVHSDNGVQYPAYLDDHAYLLSAIMVMLQARWNPDWLQLGVEMADTLLEQFGDEATRGFFFSAATQEVPMHRLRVLQDDATPSGNGIAALALIRLGHLLGEVRYLEAAEGVIHAARGEMHKYPMGHASLLRALDEHLDPVPHVVVTGRDPGELESWKALARSVDRLHCYAVGRETANLPGLAGRYPKVDHTIAHVCVGVRCLPPVERLEEFEKLINTLD